MKLLLSIITTVLFYSASAFAQIETMQLKGEGDVRFMGFIKVYDAYLYTKDPRLETDILAPEISKCLKLQYDVSLSPENFIEGANTILERQYSVASLENFKTELDLLHGAYQAVEEGDVYTLCYDANSFTTTLNLNGSMLTAIPSKEFSKLYFGIWLGKNDPIDEDLRNSLLATSE